MTSFLTARLPSPDPKESNADAPLPLSPLLNTADLSEESSDRDFEPLERRRDDSELKTDVGGEDASPGGEVDRAESDIAEFLMGIWGSFDDELMPAQPGETKPEHRHGLTCTIASGGKHALLDQMPKSLRSSACVYCC